MVRSKVALVASTLFLSVPSLPLFAAPTITTLTSFFGFDGSTPSGGVIADAAGNLYGTTQYGGSNNLGTVFEFAAGSHTLTTLASLSNSSGAYPTSGLVLDDSGNLYGTTYGGTAGNQYGSVFEVHAGTHAMTTLGTFNNANGAHPYAGVIRDSSGNLYGTALIGGSAGYGTVFEIAAGSGVITPVANFNNSNGSNVYGGLTTNGRGDLFGTTGVGGASGKGTLFKVDAVTHALTTRVNFNGANGSNPFGTLIMDASGNLYGTTSSGGGNGDGTIFEVMAGTNSLVTLASFSGTDGATPLSPLILDANGDLFGMTNTGGANNYGTVFEVVAGTDAISTVVTFDGVIAGHPYYSGLIADSVGNLYGTASKGNDGVGVVFELSNAGFVAASRPCSCVVLLPFFAAILKRRRWRREGRGGSASPRIKKQRFKKHEDRGASRGFLLRRGR